MKADGKGGGGRLHGMIVRSLGQFSAATGIRDEDDLESDICRHLEFVHGFSVRRQVVGGRGGRNRYDIVCTHPEAPGARVCVEVKLKAASSDLEQFDRYIEMFPDGLVVACWSASGPVRDIAAEAARAAPVPVGLVEVGMQHALA